MELLGTRSKQIIFNLTTLRGANERKMTRIEQNGKPDILVAPSPVFKDHVSVYQGVRLMLIEKSSIPALIEALQKEMEA